MANTLVTTVTRDMGLNLVIYKQGWLTETYIAGVINTLTKLKGEIKGKFTIAFNAFQLQGVEIDESRCKAREYTNNYYEVEMAKLTNKYPQFFNTW